MKPTKEIENERDYNSVMKKIDALMAKGSVNVSGDELLQIKSLASSAQAYEQKTYIIAAPSTLSGMIEMRMYEMRLKQRDVAKKLKISETKFSLIMNGKQRPDVDFIKAVYNELNVDAEFILQHV